MRFSLKWPWQRVKSCSSAKPETTYQFSMSFPCYVVELEPAGLVTVGPDDNKALALVTDRDLAERLAVRVKRITLSTPRPVELTGKRELLAKIREAEAVGLREVAIDPAEYRTGRFKYHSIPIDKAIEDLVQWLDKR